MDDELREAERDVMGDTDAKNEIKGIRDQIKQAEENLDIPGQEAKVRRAEADGNQADIDRERRILRERRTALKRLRESFEDSASSPKVKRLLRKLKQAGRWGLIPFLGIVIDAGISVIGAIENPRSRFRVIYIAALEGNCNRVNGLIQGKALGDHATDLEAMTGAASLSAEEFLRIFFDLAKKACRERRQGQGK